MTEQRRTELESGTLERAVRDARRRANIIARAAGVNDVEVGEVADPGLLSGTRGQPAGPLHSNAAAFRSGAIAESGDAAVILPEDVTGSATVHARFRAAVESSG